MTASPTPTRDQENARRTTEPRPGAPGQAGAMHHLAFRVDRPCEVDSVHDAVRRIPARILHAPRYWPEYCVDYYAFFFKDSEGIEYEVASFARDVYFPV